MAGWASCWSMDAAFAVFAGLPSLPRTEAGKTEGTDGKHGER